MHPDEIRIIVGVALGQRIRKASKHEAPDHAKWCIPCQGFHHTPMTEMEKKGGPCKAQQAKP